jgi:3',5'-cyclic AMP phosphodiesterase CpdA
MFLLLLACHGETPLAADAPCVAAEPEWPEPLTTLSLRVLSGERLDAPTALNPAWPDGLRAAEELGLGGAIEAPGEPRLLRTELVPGWTAPETGRRSLWMVLHQTDAQLADTESPTRLAAADQLAETQSAARPQELYAIHALDALIRQANALSVMAPIDFALATGDNVDNDQTNELVWFAAVWDGLPVHPDSGEDDTQLDADCNDPVAPFTPVGADFPWYAVAGNHDVLIQGNFDPQVFEDDALGQVADGGTRDLTLPGGPLTFLTPSDPQRSVLERGDIASVLLDGPSEPGPPGHGFTEDNVANNTAGWTALPLDGVPVRLISVDANPYGLGSAVLTAAERDGWLLPQLALAEESGELVVLTSHYALADVAMEDGGMVRDLLLQHPNVVLVLCGHSHTNRIVAVGSPDDAAGFWQIETSSTVDHPGQGRLVELVDNGDGTLSVLTTNFDYPAPEHSLAAQAARLTRIDWQSGWRLYDGQGQPTDRNTELVQRLPAAFVTEAGRPGVRSSAL